MAVIRKFFLLAAAALLVWGAVSSGMSSYYVERLQEGDSEAADKALAWNARQPDALLEKGLELQATDPDAAASLLAQAYAENPADARPLMALAKHVLTQGDQSRADALVAAAIRLMPADPRIHKQAASYWVAREDLPKALSHWSVVLDTDPSTRAQLFPVLLRLAEDPGTSPLFRMLTGSPPSWWEDFFTEVGKRGLDVENVRLLYALRRESASVPITQLERQTYVSRLQRDGKIPEAYIEWINGLSQDQRAQLGLLHDGGFELEPAGWGFDWRLQSTPSALIDRAQTYGVDGNKALHLLFKRNERRFANVSQTLFLDPGPYRLTGRSRADSLESQGGLKWTLSCIRSDTSELGESERFLGSSQWQEFHFEFTVPESCVLQELRLVSAGKRPFEQKISGGIWFDRMAIRKAPELVRAADTVPAPSTKSGGPGAATP